MSIGKFLRRGFTKGLEAKDRLLRIEELTDLTAGIEHDVKGPLQIIANEVAAMERDLQEDPKMIRRLSNIRRELRRLFSVMEIVQVLRAGPQYYKRLMSKTSLQDLVHHSIRATEEEMKLVGISFQAEGAAVYAEVDRSLLQRAIVSVIKRAVRGVQETEQGTGTVGIKWESQRNKHEDVVVLTITATGAALTDFASTRAHGKSTSQRGTATNIQLLVFHRILDIHRASVEVRRDSSDLTSLRIILPKWGDQG